MMDQDLARGSAVAAFDLGSSTTRGILAVPRDGHSLQVIALEQRMTALGRGMTESAALDPEGLDATVRFVAETLDRWQRPPQVHAVATAAARDALNAPELLARLVDEAGVHAEIIDGRQEARLAWLGALSTAPELAQHNPAVVDIGGRSTEVVLEEDGALRAISRPIGARSFTEESERIGGDVLINGTGFEIAREALADAIKRATQRDTVVCIGGTAEAVAYLTGRHEVSAAQIADLNRELHALPLERRREVMEFDPERAEIICAGLVILEAFARAARGEVVIISEGGVREGLLLDRTGATRLEWAASVHS
ncbi:MAG: Ppx/GppA phosphatase family protein [Armatimonadota bacterium]|jgi:exopolyphosphatase/guanosine-5'-triphosphate,3'-diphosphate pyrophosphatase